MPFDFLKRRKDAPEVIDESTGRPVGRGVPFDGLTEEWRIVGEMHIPGRLSDALNKREAVTISDVRWAPVDGSEELSEASGLKAVDPYDLIMVMAGAATLPPLTEAERAAYKVHKVPYDVALEVPPFRVIGTVYMTPGTEPERLLDRATEMFVPVVAASAYLGEQQIGRRDGCDPRQSLLPARPLADRPAHRRTAAAAPGRPARRHELAGPLSVTRPESRTGRGPWPRPVGSMRGARAAMPGREPSGG